MEQKKYPRFRTIGSVVKSKDPTKGDYIKINEDVTLRKGDILNLESKKAVQDRLESLKAAGRLKPESEEKLQKYINNWKDFVRFEVKQKQND